MATYFSFMLVALTSLMVETNSFQLSSTRFQGNRFNLAPVMMSQSKDSLEPVSIQDISRRGSTAVLPFLATLLATGLAAHAAGTGSGGFLTEPTAEFKDEEKKVADFKAQQQKIRKSWDEVIAKLEASDNPTVTESSIRDLTAILTKYNSGIPSGVKKLELVKTIRAKKYVMVGKKQKILPTWSKESEIAYQVTLVTHEIIISIHNFIRGRLQIIPKRN